MLQIMANHDHMILARGQGRAHRIVIDAPKMLLGDARIMIAWQVLRISDVAGGCEECEGRFEILCTQVGYSIVRARASHAP